MKSDWLLRLNQYLVHPCVVIAKLVLRGGGSAYDLGKGYRATEEWHYLLDFGSSCVQRLAPPTSTRICMEEEQDVKQNVGGIG